MQVKPGVYYDVPFSDYLQVDAVSNSRLGLAARSAAHFKQGFRGESTPALRLGSFTHCGVLEPLQLPNRYVVEPNFAAMPENVDKKGERSYSHATTFVKEARAQFASANGRKAIVSQAEYDKVIGIATSLHKEQRVKELMTFGDAEVSLVWPDMATGLLCKCRIDWLTVTTKRAIVDLKTCRDPLRFESSIAEYGYHRQMAFYRRGVDAILGEVADAWLIAVETESPYCSRTAKVSEAALRTGDDEVSELLDLVAECKAVDAWPGYSNPTEWELPAWKTRETELELDWSGIDDAV
jgi:exodeoxyribonuclease VIII